MNFERVFDQFIIVIMQNDQLNLDNFKSYAQGFHQKNIQFNPQQYSKHLPLSTLNSQFFVLKQTQMPFTYFQIKSSYLFIVLLLIVCTYNKVIDVSSLTQIGNQTLQTLNSQIPLPNPPIDASTCQQYKIKNNKKYSSPSENLYRCIVYKNNQKKINYHNSKNERSFNQALNEFADLTSQEFMLIYTTTFASSQVVRDFASNYISMEQAAIAQENGQSVNPGQNIPNLNQTQLNQILAMVANQVQRRNSKLSNQSIDQNNLFNLSQTFKKKNMPNFPKNTVYPDQILDIENNFQGFIQYFLQRFQNLTQEIVGKTINKIQLKQFLMQNKISILNSLGLNESVIAAFQNSTDNQLVKINVKHQFDQVLADIYENGSIKLTSSGPLNTNSPRLLQTLTTSTTSDTSLSSTIKIDWTYHAGAVRYQGICGACYTFASSDAVASLYSIYKYGFFVPLSTQQVIDCSNNGLTYGCGGGFLQGSFAYMQVRGVTTDYSYPYTSSTNGLAGTCKFQGGNFKISLFKNVNAGSCSALIQELKYGPVSIGIAGYRLQFYSTGVFNDCNSYIDHAVVLIGYRSGFGWKIKNSWGTSWGINGFGWIADGNNCGICDMAVAPKL